MNEELRHWVIENTLGAVLASVFKFFSHGAYAQK